jgi:hypothetical protein
LEIETEQGTNEYRFRLGYAADDSLIFLEEKCRFSARERRGANPNWIDFGAGHRTPLLLRPEQGTLQRTQNNILYLLRRLAVYPFHDASDSARIKQRSPIDDNRYLRGDAGNIAPFLLRLRERETQYYMRILQTTRTGSPVLRRLHLRT